MITCRPLLYSDVTVYEDEMALMAYEAYKIQWGNLADGFVGWLEKNPTGHRHAERIENARLNEL